MAIYDVIIVGKGMIGSAAARYLSAAGSRVALVGQDEPPDYAVHDGVFASHYDEGRLVYHVARDTVWTRLNVRSIESYVAIENASGIRFHTPRGVLTVVRDLDKHPRMKQREQSGARFGIRYTIYPSDGALRNAHAMLAFPGGFQGLFEPGPAGFINPRALVRAQTKIAADQGAEIVSDLVVALEPKSEAVMATTRSGRQIAANRVLLACGAFANAYSLTQKKLTLRVKSETVLLAEVGECEVGRLADMPAVVFGIESTELDAIYMTPPIRYPDGKYYIKMGCNTASDQTLPDLKAMQHWMRQGNADIHKEALVTALYSIIPGLQAESVRTHRCIVAYTTHGNPYIDRIADRVWVATGGNGASAKCSDTLGCLAANMLLERPWGEFEHESFRAM